MNQVEYLKKATEYLDRHDIESPRLNAELLLCKVLGISRIQIYTCFERELSPSESGAYRDLLVRRAANEPLQYLTGETSFRGLRIETGCGVFIPRPETELLVEYALQALPSGEATVLELGCGTGCIALSLVNEHERLTVTAVDKDPAAIALSSRNADELDPAGRVTFIEGDLFTPLCHLGQSFDMVISNPPYVPEGAAASLPPEVMGHEPHGALFAGPEGLDVIRRIIEEAPAFLKRGGHLLLEIDESHADAVERMLGGQPSGSSVRWTDIRIIEDLAERPRISIATMVES